MPRDVIGVGLLSVASATQPNALEQLGGTETLEFIACCGWPEHECVLCE